MNNFDIVKNKRWFLILSAIIIVVGIVGYFVGGLNYDIDFAGGTNVQYNIGKQFENDDVSGVIKETLGTNATVQKINDGTEVLIKVRETDDEKISALGEALKAKFEVAADAEFETSRRVVSASYAMKNLRDTFMLILLAAILMLVYIAIRFTFLSGLAAIVALFHDMLIILSFYAVFKMPFNNTVIAAIVTIFGYSINATIVTFDRIRENVKFAKKESFGEVVNKSIWQTFARSLNTTISTLLTVVTIYILGVDAIREFALPLIIGIVAGLYSSVFIAGPVWEVFYNVFGAKKKR